MAQVQLEAGKPAKIEFFYWPDEGQVGVGMGVIADDELIDPQALAIAAKADAAVVSVGFDAHRFLEAEASDRAYILPGGQDKLIEAIAASIRTPSSPSTPAAASPLATGSARFPPSSKPGTAVSRPARRSPRFSSAR